LKSIFISFFKYQQTINENYNTNQTNNSHHNSQSSVNIQKIIPMPHIHQPLNQHLNVQPIPIYQTDRYKDIVSKTHEGIKHLVIYLLIV